MSHVRLYSKCLHPFKMAHSPDLPLEVGMMNDSRWVVSSLCASNGVELSYSYSVVLDQHVMNCCC